MLTIVLLILMCAALTVVAFSIGLCWLVLGDTGEDGRSHQQPLSLTQAFARELEGRRLWRALSGWMAEKPLRLERRRDPDRS